MRDTPDHYNSQPPSPISAEFFDALGRENLFFRALWPKKLITAGIEQPNPLPPPHGQREVTIGYGPWSPQIAAECDRLNRLGYGIYFGANDPGQGNPLQEKHIDNLDNVYRECDGSEEPSPSYSAEVRFALADVAQGVELA